MTSMNGALQLLLLIAVVMILLKGLASGESMPKRRAEDVPDDESANDESANEDSPANLHQRAASGDTEAMLALASLYASGENVTQDFEEAFHLCRSAVDAGNSDAYLPLATMYHRGRGVARDEIKALELYRKAAEQGSVDAMITAGWMMVKGIGADPDPGKGLELLKEAERRGAPEHLTRIADMYLDGDGLPLDPKHALELYKAAAEARPAFHDIYGFHLGFPPDPFAMLALGRMYSQGRGIDRDAEMAAVWFGRAIQSEDVRVLEVLATMYGSGDCVEKNEQQAAELQQMADKQKRKVKY